MTTELNNIRNYRVSVAGFLLAIILAAIPLRAFAQNNDLDLENELATEPIAAPNNQNANSKISFSEGGDTIIVERMKDLTLPYKLRRNPWGILFSINYEKFYPENYTSLILQKDYKTISGDKEIPMTGAEFGVKYNFALGAISALIGYSRGEVSNSSTGLNQINISITKADLNFALDNLMDEPFVVPYAQVGIHTVNWTEKSTVGANSNDESFSTDYNLHYKVGLSFQLNWIEKSIDPTSQEESIRSGLENTFIDVFYTSYAQPAQVASANNAQGEADLQSNEIGAGLKLEF